MSKKNNVENNLTAEIGSGEPGDEISDSDFLDYTDAKKVYNLKDKKLQGFKELLDSISSVEDKKKALWREVYENALVDRNNAYMLFINLWLQIKKNKDEATHSILGPIITKYLERMSKANDQLLKLAELIAAVDKKNSELNEEEVFSKLQQ